MFNFFFNFVELLGVIGIVQAMRFVHSYSLGHKWLRHTSQYGAWTLALIYGVGALVLFWLAHNASGSIYVILWGVSGGWTILSYLLLALLAVVIFHVAVGACWAIPYLARGLAALSSRGK
jgi:hypothetical protein